MMFDFDLVRLFLSSFRLRACVLNSDVCMYLLDYGSFFLCVGFGVLELQGRKRKGGTPIFVEVV